MAVKLRIKKLRGLRKTKRKGTLKARGSRSRRKLNWEEGGAGRKAQKGQIITYAEFRNPEITWGGKPTGPKGARTGANGSHCHQT